MADIDDFGTDDTKDDEFDEVLEDDTDSDEDNNKRELNEENT